MSCNDVTALTKAVASIVPAADGIVPAPAYPPHVALFFSPWARLAYLDARWLWFAVSSIAYLAGTAVVIRGVAELRGYRSLAWTTAVFSPLLAMVLTTGQLSTAAMLFWALAMAAFTNRRRLLCGICLGLLAYKPSLLIGVVPRADGRGNMDHPWRCPALRGRAILRVAALPWPSAVAGVRNVRDRISQVLPSDGHAAPSEAVTSRIFSTVRRVQASSQRVWPLSPESGCLRCGGHIAIKLKAAGSYPCWQPRACC